MSFSKYDDNNGYIDHYDTGTVQELQDLSDIAMIDAERNKYFQYGYSNKSAFNDSDSDTDINEFDTPDDIYENYYKETETKSEFKSDIKSTTTTSDEEEFGRKAYNSILDSVDVDEISEQLTFIFWMDNEKTFILGKNRFNTLINSLIKKNLLNEIFKQWSDCLTIMTQTYVFEYEAYDKIIKMDISNQGDTWKDNLKNNGFVVGNKTMEDIRKDLSNKSSYYDIIPYLKINNIRVTYDIIQMMPSWSFNSHSFFEELLKECNVESSFDIVCQIKPYIDYKKIKGFDKYIEPLINESQIKGIERVLEQRVPEHSLYILNMCDAKNLVLPFEICIKTLKKTEKHTTKYYNSIEESYKFSSDYSTDPTGDYFQILTYIMERYPDRTNTMEFFNYIQHVVEDELFLQILIDNITEISETTLLDASYKCNTQLISKIAKLKPEYTTKEWIDKYIAAMNIDETNDKMVNFILTVCDFVDHIDLKTIELIFSKGIAIEGSFVKSYGIPETIELYELCHRYKLYPKFHISGINHDLRNHIRSEKYTDEEIIECFLKYNITPDQMMYDDAVDHNKKKLVKFFENTYNFVPNYDTLVRIDNFSVRVAYYERIKNMNHKRIHTKLHSNYKKS